jgi:nucleoside-diphosphate-sugar epimerase
MRVLVIGGTEFIGRRTVELLAERGDDVLVVHRGRTEPEPVLGTHLHVARKEFEGHKQAVADFRPDAVVDMMALTAADVDAILPHLPDVPIVVLSSMDVYEAWQNIIDERPATVPVPFDEDGPLRAVRYPYRDRFPDTHSDYDKLDVEPAYLARGATALRLGMVYGPRDPQRREEPVLRRVRAGRRRIPVGPGALLLPRLHVEDAALAVQRALDRPDRAAGHAVNVAESATYPVNGWIRAVLAAAGHEADLVRVPDDVLPPDLRLTRGVEQQFLASVAKAETLLGWRAGDPHDGIKRSTEWHLANPPAEEDQDFSADDEALETVTRPASSPAPGPAGPGSARPAGGTAG